MKYFYPDVDVDTMDAKGHNTVDLISVYLAKNPNILVVVVLVFFKVSELGLTKPHSSQFALVMFGFIATNPHLRSL